MWPANRFPFRTRRESAVDAQIASRRAMISMRKGQLAKQEPDPIEVYRFPRSCAGRREVGSALSAGDASPADDAGFGGCGMGCCGVCEIRTSRSLSAELPDVFRG